MDQDRRQALVLTVLVWHEPGTESGMRARIRQTVDLTQPGTGGGYVSTPEEITTVIRTALESFLATGPITPRATRGLEGIEAAPATRDAGVVVALGRAKRRPVPVPMTEAEVRNLVFEWLRKFEMHAPVNETLALVADKPRIELPPPDGRLGSREEFERWYDRVTHRFFDESHAMKRLEIAVRGAKAHVTLCVIWETRIWDPPASKSEWLGFEEHQRWVVVRDPVDGRPKILSYIIDEMVPLPGSRRL